MSKEEYHYVFKQIGDNIRKAREAKRLSQEELAFLINSARNYIGCIERAEKFASVTMLKKDSGCTGFETCRFVQRV